MNIVGVLPIDVPELCFLVEVKFATPIRDYNWIEVTQEEIGQPKGNWQVPYDEQPLDDTHERWVFFFHYLDLNKPLLTPDGPICLPEPSPLPEYLQDISYQEPD